MSNGFLTMNEKDWAGMSAEQQSWATFNTLQSMDIRLKKLESKPIIDKFFSFAGGIVGGALSYLGIKMS